MKDQVDVACPKAVRCHVTVTYVTVLLSVVYVFNQLDRMVFLLLMEPIKREFLLTDAQLAFLGGPALFLIYTLLGVPMARCGDRRRRVMLMAGATAVWSVIVALTATVQGFWTLALVRVGVGVGEAGFSAIAISVIGDYESDERRTRAVASFMLAFPIASVVSDLMGGWVNQFYGWRLVFLVAGLAGIPLAFLLATTVREPARRLSSVHEGIRRAPFGAVLGTLWNRRSLRHLAVAQGLSNMAANSLGTWMSVFFVRKYHMVTGELGSWFAVADAIGGCGSIWLSGILASRFAAPDNALARTRQVAVGALLVVPLALFVVWIPAKEAALVALVLLNLPLLFNMAPIAALVQDLVGPDMRATMASIFFLIQMLLAAVAIQMIGILSDVLGSPSDDSATGLSWCMTLGSSITVWAAVHYWLAGRFVRADLAVVGQAQTLANPIAQDGVPV